MGFFCFLGLKCFFRVAFARTCFFINYDPITHCSCYNCAPAHVLPVAV